MWCFIFNFFLVRKVEILVNGLNNVCLNCLVLSCELSFFLFYSGMVVDIFFLVNCLVSVVLILLVIKILLEFVRLMILFGIKVVSLLVDNCLEIFLLNN